MLDPTKVDFKKLFTQESSSTHSTSKDVYNASGLLIPIILVVIWATALAIDTNYLKINQGNGKV